MKITNKQLKQIIKEELQAVIDEGIYDPISSDKEAEKALRNYFLNYLKEEGAVDEKSEIEFIYNWISGDDPGHSEWTNWQPLYNAWKTSATGTMGLDPSELLDVTVNALSPIVQSIMSKSNNARQYNYENVKMYIRRLHT